ncbi:MAG: glycerol-3-phosphate acyltransferase [Bacteroidales bacterium]
MYPVSLLICLLVAYLAGSINFAILISRWAKGIDIRQVGNRNPGTSNVGREVGRGWAALVFLGDMAKGLVPLILARELFFTGEDAMDYLPLFLTGIAAITGHCWPLFFQFKGGGGLATSIGVYMFFIPVEFFLVLLSCFAVNRLVFRNERYPVGQLMPMCFVPVTPVLTLVSALFVEIQFPGNITVGGYPWHLVAGVALLSIYIFILNLNIVRGRFSKEGPA